MWHGLGQGATWPAALPGHTVVQAVFWKAWPSQNAPPLSGVGLVQVRVRFCQPRPQRLEQGDHSAQLDQPPFTARAAGVTQLAWLCNSWVPQTPPPTRQGLSAAAWPFLGGPLLPAGLGTQIPTGRPGLSPSAPEETLKVIFYSPPHCIMADEGLERASTYPGSPRE